MKNSIMRLPGYLFWRLRRILYRRLACHFQRLFQQQTFREGQLIRALDPSRVSGWPNPHDIVSHFRQRSQPKFFFQDFDLPDLIDAIRRSELDVIGQTVEIAERIFKGAIDVLGLGPVYMGTPPDWHKDLLTGLKWPMTHYTQLDYCGAGAGTDARLTWEVNRCHHFVILGQAYRYTGERRYAETFARQLRDWCSLNPVGWGINWTVAMEASIRIINWIWAYYLLRNAPEIKDDDWAEFLFQVNAHGNYILHNLEYALIAGNHYLANAAGLVYLGLLFPEFKAARKWLNKGLKILWEEIPRQTYQDGANFEGSVGYHRLALDLCLTPILLCRINKIEVPEHILKTLEHMYDFILGYLKPDGTAPNFGDNDDGRLLRLASRPHNDHRSLLATGASLFDRSDLNDAAGSCRAEALWLFGPKAARHIERAVTPRSVAFLCSGIYIMRNKSFYLALDAGNVGHRGRGTHAHNDTLSFELSALGVNFIVDSGTYLYTHSLSERNRLRGTGAHNVVVVDGAEMARWSPPTSFWGIRDDAKPVVKHWRCSERYDVFVGERYGYTHLSNSVVHSRRVIFDRCLGFWVLEDVLTGSGNHTAELLFHFNPCDLQRVDETSNAIYATHSSEVSLLITPLQEGNLTLKITKGPISLTYAHLVESPVAIYTRVGKIPMIFQLMILPFSANQKVDVNSQMSYASNCLNYLHGLLNKG